MDLLDILNSYNSLNTKNLCESYLIQIMDAIEYLHENNIAHLDIKLENLIIHEGTVKLIDFGNACKITDKKCIVYGGTFDYLSPEVLKKMPFDAKSADVWAFGVVLYNLVYNKPPWDYTKLKYNEIMLIHDKIVSILNNNVYYDTIFTSIINNGYSEQDNEMILLMFTSIFQFEPENRKSITELKNMYKLT